MSRIYTNGHPNWAPDPSSHAQTPSFQDGRQAVDTNDRRHDLNSDSVDNNSWNIQRLMELDRSKNWRDSYNPRMSMSFTNTKGLLNAPGDNNCFLNSAVQVLWHLDVFRRSFRMLSGHLCLGNSSCIFCALKVIFTQFQYSDQSALPPDSLRTALAKTFADQRRFQLGLMDDAAECFENILTQIHFHIANGESEDMCNARHCIPHQMFAMTVVEQIVCPCEATSEPLPFNQMVHYISTSALVNQVKTRTPQTSGATFGGLLRQALSAGDYRNCPSACGRKVQLRRTLMNRPSVISVGLVWDSDNPSSDHIHDVVRSIGTTLRLTELFHTVVDPKCRLGPALQLVGIVCYYGKHYSTFFFHSKMKMWVSFDDANIKEMGSQWSAVVDKCCRGHYQPLLLLYANPDAEPICTSTAPQKTTIVKESKFLNNNDESGMKSSGIYHCRQRSCDSLSGTVGGQCVDDVSEVDTSHVKSRRAMTPNPDTRPAEVQYIPRRSVTPGPEWGSYSTGESQHKSKPESKHSRQPSYLTALDTVSGTNGTASNKPSAPVDPYQHATAPPAHQVHRPNAVHAKPVQNIGAYNVRYAQQGANTTNSVDLLGSIPHQAPGQQTDSYGNHHGQSVHQNNTQQYGHQGYQQQHVPSYHGNSAYSAVSSSQQPIVSVARTSSSYNVTNSHGGPSQHYSTGPHHAPHSSTTYPVPTSAYSGPAQGVTTQEPVPGHQAVSAPNTPVIKRTRSLESSDSVAVQSQHQRPTVSRARPSSARPYDYGNSRPTVDPTTGAIIMPSRQATTTHGSNGVPQNGVKQEWAEDVLVGDFTTPDSCEPASSSKDIHPKLEDEEDYGTYINRKTVQNVLNIQKNRTQPAGPVGTVGGIKTAAMHGSNSSLEAADQKQQKAWLHNQALMRDLKVDIPGDNISLGSHKDSGYRSGGSSGDRNSASSNSSTSFDSPTADSFRGFPTPGLYRGLGNTYSCSSHSSSESLSSNQSGQTVKTIQGNRLSLIPENRPPSSSNSSSATVNQSQESLVGSQGTIGSQDGLDYSSQDQHTGPGLHMDSTDGPHTHRTAHGVTYLQGLDAECERLFLQAESLMESSNKQEENSDIHSSLAYCNQAISCLQKALNNSGASNDTIVRLRMKHNSCVLRSRRLHKSILDRQLSSQSTASSQSGSVCSVDSAASSRTSDDSARYSSTKPDCQGQGRTRRRSDHHLIDLVDQPKAAHQVLQETVRDLYGRPQQGRYSNGNDGHQTVVSKQVAVSGVVQSRPVHGVTMGTCNIPKSATDTTLSHYSHEQPQKHKPASRSRNNSLSNDLEREDFDASETRNVEIYGTLPKRKGKGGKTVPIAVPTPTVPSDNVQVYQSYLQRQKSAASSVDDKSAFGSYKSQGDSTVVNHSRSLSKDEVKDILLKDYMSRPDCRAAPSKPDTQPPPNMNQCQDRPRTRRRNSYDLLDPQVRNATSAVHSRQNSFEDVLSQKTGQMDIQDLPPKQRQPTQHQFVVPAQPARIPGGAQRREESHYDYLPGRQNQAKSLQSDVRQPHSSPVKIVPAGYVSTHSPARYPDRSDQSSYRPESVNPAHARHDESVRGNPSVVRCLDQSGQKEAYVKSYEIQRPGEQGKPAVGETVAIKVKPDLPPKTMVKSKSVKPSKPAKAAKPDVPKRISSQLSTFKGDTCDTVSHTAPKPSNSHTSGSQGWTQQNSVGGTPPGPDTSDYDFPPPPDDLLYPTPSQDAPPPPAADAKSQSRCTCGAGQTVSSAPGYRELNYNNSNGVVQNSIPHTHQPSGQATHSVVPLNDVSPQSEHLPPPTPQPPPKPAVAKKKPTLKGRKSVTFSDNVALIATPEEVSQEIDYVAYVMNLGRKKSAECDTDDNTADSMDGDEMLKGDTVLCTLCRKKHIEPTEIYCEGCCFYMSQFQSAEQ